MGKKESVRKFRLKTYNIDIMNLSQNVTHGIKETWPVEKQYYAGDDLIIS